MDTKEIWLEFRQHGWYANTVWFSPPSSHEEAHMDYYNGVVCTCLSNLRLCLIFQMEQGEHNKTWIPSYQAAL